MTVVAVGSLTGSPGATTLAIALAAQAPGRVLLVEADPDGGRLAARADLAVRPGLTDLAATCRLGLDDPEDLWHYAQHAAMAGVPVVVAHPSADVVGAALRAAAGPLAAAFAALTDADVVVDVGRFRPGSPAAAIAAGADRRLVVTRPSLDDLAVLAHRRQLLESLGGHTVVCVGRRPYGHHEVARVTGDRVVAVPDHPRGRAGQRRYNAAAARLAELVFSRDGGTALASP